MATTQAAPGKKGLINFDFLQKLGKVLMTVIAVMPAAGLIACISDDSNTRQCDADSNK